MSQKKVTWNIYFLYNTFVHNYPNTKIVTYMDAARRMQEGAFALS